MPKDKPGQINQRLVDERLNRGWSQQDLADRVGTTPVNVSRWERGKTNPNPHFRQRLASIFEKSPQALGLITPPQEPLSEEASQIDLVEGEQQQDGPSTPSHQQDDTLLPDSLVIVPLPASQFDPTPRSWQPTFAAHISTKWRITLVCILILASTTYLLLRFAGNFTSASTVTTSYSSIQIINSFKGATVDTSSYFLSTKRTNSFDWDHTIASHNNRLLLVEVVTASIDNNVLSVSLGDISLNPVKIAICPKNCRDEVWYGIGLPVGKHPIKVVTYDQQPVTAIALSLYNVDQTNPFGTISTTNGDDVSSTLSVASNADQLIIDFYGNQATTPFIPVPGHGQTQQVNKGDTIAQEAASSTQVGAAKSTTMTWSWAHMNNYVDIGIPLNAA